MRKDSCVGSLTPPKWLILANPYGGVTCRFVNGSARWRDVGGWVPAVAAMPACHPTLCWGSQGHGGGTQPLNRSTGPGSTTLPANSLPEQLLGTALGMSPYLRGGAGPRPPPGHVPVLAGGAEGLGAALPERPSVSRGVPPCPHGSGTAWCWCHPCQVIQGVRRSHRLSGVRGQPREDPKRAE